VANTDSSKVQSTRRIDDMASSGMLVREQRLRMAQKIKQKHDSGYDSEMTGHKAITKSFNFGILRPYIPAARIHNHSCENLKSYKAVIILVRKKLYSIDKIQFKGNSKMKTNIICCGV
jgi:hypothetical protein